MRVLLVTGSLPPMRCGVGDYTLGLAQALAAQPDVEVGVLTSDQAVTPPDSRLQVFPNMGRWKLRELGRAIHAIRRFSPDIVHIQDPTQGYRGYAPFLLPVIVRLLGKRVVRTWHEVPHPAHARRYRLQSADRGPILHVRPDLAKDLPAELASRRTRQFVYIPNASVIPKSGGSKSELRALRERYLQGQRRLIVFFGFIFAHKGVDRLFDIADPQRDHVVIAGQHEEGSAYYAELKQRASTAPWQGHVTFTGFLDANASADLLAAADAVVLPFRRGGGIWNTSIHAAVTQGTFVLSTAEPATGYDTLRNIHFAAPEDVSGMKSALEQYAGRKRAYSPEVDDEWTHIARQHVAVYEKLLGRRAS